MVRRANQARIAAVALVSALLGACSAATNPSVTAMPLAPAAPAPHLVSPPAIPAKAMQVEHHPARSSRGRLDLRVDRLWSERGQTHASLTVRNTATFDLVLITVSCTAYGPTQVALEAGERTILSPGQDPLGPGSAKTTQISLRSPDLDVRSMSCEANAI